MCYHNHSINILFICRYRITNPFIIAIDRHVCVCAEIKILKQIVYGKYGYKSTLKDFCLSKDSLFIRSNCYCGFCHNNVIKSSSTVWNSFNFTHDQGNDAQMTHGFTWCASIFATKCHIRALLMKSTTNIWWNHWRNNVKSVTFCIFNEVQYWSKSMVKKSTCCVWVSFGAKNQEKLTARLLRNTFRWSANYIRITYPFVFSLQWKQERLLTCEDCDILIAMVIYWHEW